MAKEITKVKETETKEQAAISGENVTTLPIEREKFEFKGRDLWGYVVRSNVNGRDVKVDFVAYDAGGYEVLDLVFDLSEKNVADLVMHEEYMTNEETGEIRAYTVYEVQNIDEDGDVLSCRVKPAKSSDKSTLDYLLKKLARQQTA